MAMIKSAEIWYTKLNPKRPNAKYNKKNPTWEIQIRTYSPATKKAWEAMNLNCTAVLPEEEGEKPYWRVNLKKKSLDKDGEPAKPVKIVDGQLNEIDPDTIANGSIGNIRIFQYEYDNDGDKGIASMLMAIQLTKHIVYVPKPRDDDFEMTDTEVIAGEGEEEEGEEAEGEHTPTPARTPTPAPALRTQGNDESDDY